MRRDAREYALQVLYSKELNPESEPIDAENLNLTDKDRAFAAALVAAVGEHEEIDETIKAHLKNWSLAQLNTVDKNILRLAIAEYYFSGEDRSDRKVIIDEAVEMAKTFGGEKSYRFINGLLDHALKG